MHPVRRPVTVLGAAALLLALAPGAAAAPTFTIGSPVLVSGPSPFAGCTLGAADETSVNYPNTEVEPFVAVNPTNPRNVIGVFQQDRWNDGAAHSTGAAFSTDGGATWARRYPPFAACAGGDPDYLRATDPWVSFDGAGRAYQLSQFVDSAELGLSGLEASTSTDGGATWSTPVVITDDRDGVIFNDKISVTGDPTRSGYAYAAWLRQDLPGRERNVSKLIHSFSYRGSPAFSRTTDGGRTWSAPVALQKSNEFAQGNQIVVLPDGTLIDVFARLYQGSGVQPGNPIEYVAMRSNDAGRSWGRPVRIAIVDSALLTNPDVPEPTTSEETVRAGDYIPDVAVDPRNGTIYMVWASGNADGWNHVVLVKSTDGGKKWTAPKQVGTTPATTHSFNGTVEVTSDGTVAVMFYDFRANTLGAGLPTDVWLALSSDGGASFSEQHVTGPFDMTAAPNAGGWFLGDYQGMAAAGRDLILFFATTQGDAANVYAVRASH
jgi:hypothetical protein